MNKLDKVLDEAMKLSLEQQEMLLQILKNRINEHRREQIALDALTSLEEFQERKFKIQTASEAIQEVREYIDNPNLDK